MGFMFATTCIALSTLLVAANAGAAYAEQNKGMPLEGVNISGGEFNQTTVPGVEGTNYVYPLQSEIDYYASKGMTVIRIPFSWERMQPTASGELSTSQLARLDQIVNMICAKNMYVIIDPHNYGAHYNSTVGVPGGLPNAAFADFWSRLAQHYAKNPRVIFGLMNEPVGSTMTAATWRASAQAAIDAIRAAGAKNLILVPSTYWGHPVNFLDLNASEMIKITDPKNNWAYDVHQYLDYDGSGTHTDFPSVADSVALFSDFTNWLLVNKRRAFLSEMGVTSAPGALADLDAILKYMHTNSKAWIGYSYWTAGRWFPPDYLFRIQPDSNGNDMPQMTVMLNNLAKHRQKGKGNYKARNAIVGGIKKP